MFRHAWKTWRSCSPASDSMCADSPARSRLAGWTCSPRASSTRVTGSCASQSISRSGWSARSSRAIATSRREWPRPIGLETNSARRGRAIARAPRPAHWAAAPRGSRGQPGSYRTGSRAPGAVARALEGARAPSRRSPRGRARRARDGRAPRPRAPWMMSVGTRTPGESCRGSSISDYHLDRSRSGSPGSSRAPTRRRPRAASSSAARGSISSTKNSTKSW